MASLVIDTHSAIWHLENSPRLSVTAHTAIQSAIAAGDPVYISSVTVVELTYLVEKGRFPATLLDQLLDLFRHPASGVRVAPFDLVMAETLGSIPGSTVRDMPDRMIAATAVALGLPLVSRDRQIHASGISVIW
jgi:PIN domain nuclease of toxin-antitoxin system